MFIWTLADGSGISHDHSEGRCPFEPGGSMAGHAEQVREAMVARGATCPDCGKPAHSQHPAWSMSPPQRVEFIDHMLGHHPNAPRFDRLSSATLARLDQLKVAMCDDEVDEDTSARLDGEFCNYLDGLPDDEQEQAHLAVMAFAVGMEAFHEAFSTR